MAFTVGIKYGPRPRRFVTVLRPGTERAFKSPEEVVCWRGAGIGLDSTEEMRARVTKVNCSLNIFFSGQPRSLRQKVLLVLGERHLFRGINGFIGFLLDLVFVWSGLVR